MKFVDFVKTKFFSNKERKFTFEMNGFNEAAAATSFNVTELALFTAIDLIARNLAKCEFVTVSGNKANTGAEYYLWNIEPNRHQTKVEFIVEAITNLIFDNELLIFESTDNQLLIADSFSKTKYAFLDDTFSNITCRNMTLQRTFVESDVIYLKYNNFALRGILASMCSTYEALMLSAQERYNKSVGRKGFLRAENMESGTEEFNKVFKDILADRFKDFFNKKNALVPLFDGYKYEELPDNQKASNSEINDIQKLRDEAYSTVGNAFHIPPAILKGEASQLSDAVDSFIAGAIDPLADMLQQEIVKKRYGSAEFQKGNYLLIDTTYCRHIDAISSAANIDKSIADGVLSIYQTQKYCNMLPNDEEWAKQHYITKNYQTAETALKGGE